MNEIINKLIGNFDFGYMLVVNVLTYLIIKVVDSIDNRPTIPIVEKRIYLFVSILIVTGIYILIGYEDNIVLINSAILAPIAWSWIFRPIINKLGLGYK